MNAMCRGWPEVQGTKVSLRTWLWYLARQILKPQTGPEVTRTRP
jgi:hypothetical protein